jgi:hypothetical protein
MVTLINREVEISVDLFFLVAWVQNHESMILAKLSRSTIDRMEY